MALKARLEETVGESAGSDTTDTAGTDGDELSFEPVGADPDPFLMQWATDRFDVDIDTSDQALGLLIAVATLT